MLRETFVSALGLQLAYKKVGGDKVPSIVGMAQGITTLIPGFDLKFGKATVDPISGTITWPKNKVGLVETQYDWYEQMTTLALEHMKLVNPKIMGIVAPAVWRERTTPGSAFVPMTYTYLLEKYPDYDMTNLEKMTVWTAGRIVYYASRGIRTVREAGNRDSFNPKTQMTSADVEKFITCELNPLKEIGDSEGTAEFDHTSHITSSTPSDVNSVDFWDIAQRIGNRDIFTLDEVELVQATDFQAAAKSYLSYLVVIEPTGVELHDEIERQVVSAKEAMASRNAAEDTIDCVQPKKAATKASR